MMVLFKLKLKAATGGERKQNTYSTCDQTGGWLGVIQPLITTTSARLIDSLARATAPSTGVLLAQPESNLVLVQLYVA